MHRMLSMCINWKVLAVLGVAGVALFLIAPSLALTALPLLLIAICPLSMLAAGLFGMKAMRGEAGSHSSTNGQQQPEQITSPAEKLLELKATREQLNREIELTKTAIATRPQPSENGASLSE